MTLSLQKARPARADRCRYTSALVSNTYAVFAICLLLLPLAGCRQDREVPFCRLQADPNPAIRCPKAPPPAVELGWFCEPPIIDVELRVGDRQGDLLAEGGAYGSARTGNWLFQATTFWLLDKETQQLLAKTLVRVEQRSCQQ